MRIQSNKSKLPKARENSGDEVVIGFSFASDWSSKGCVISGPITEQSKAKLMKSRLLSPLLVKSCNLLSIWLVIIILVYS